MFLCILQFVNTGLNKGIIDLYGICHCKHSGMHIKALCRLIRPQQWIKNGFVFLPIFFGRSLFDAHIWAYAIIAFIAFCGISSAVYCMNDIRDVASDRRHPRKCRRPIAAGLISVNQAWITFVILVCISFALSVLCLNPTSGMYVSLILLTYLILNVAYSSGLKKVSILDYCCPIKLR